MRLADDTRGRVPFALIGVLLLLGSTTYATTLATDGVRVDRDVEVAMDRATAATQTALRVAVTDAARDAARTPVSAPVAGDWGDVIDDARPFRDALRIRIYVAARAGFDRAAYSRGDVTAAASLPPTPTPASLARELDRVTVEGTENGTALRVRLRNVSVVARQDGRVVARETTNRTVTVATPVLAMHDRTVRFERSLDNGTLDGPGLGRRLTARLYPLVWARGYAQWGGLPIGNVVATRHVGIATNGAVLRLQQAAYGRADPGGRTARQRALVRLAASDARAGLSTPATDLVTNVGFDPSTVDPDDAPDRVPRLAPVDGPTPHRTARVGVNLTADRAFVSLSEGTEPSLDDVLSRAYRVDLRLRTRADVVETEPWPRPRAPDDGADLVNESVTSDATVGAGDHDHDHDPSALPAAVDGWTRLRNATRRVTVRHRIERTWQDGNRTVVTSRTTTETHVVGVAVDGRPVRLDVTPTRPVAPVFERGGALDGPNLADVPAEADAFLDARGGVDGVAARRVVDGPGGLDRNGTVTGTRPDALDDWVSADLATLRQRVRNASVAVSMDDVAVGRANPSARLAAALDDRRPALVDAPGRYDGVADRARVAARAAYLDRVRARLVDRANATRSANDRLVAQLRRAGVDLSGHARDVMSHWNTTVPEPGPVAGPLGGADVFVPQGGPAYLDVQGVDGSDVPWTERGGTVYPLATRNVNVFTVPYGDAADAVVGAATGPETVRLRTAALTLRAAERAGAPDRSDLRVRRDRLREAVADAILPVEERTRRVLSRETSLSPREQYRVVDAATARWDRTSARALAVTNGSFVGRVVAAAEVEGAAADRLRVRLRVAVADVRDSRAARVPRRHVDATASAVRRVSTTVATEALGTAVANSTERLAARTEGDAVILPAGLPLLPTPTNWYATVNVWEISVRGVYPRFAVRTARGAPGETVTYVRDGGDATLDVDGDGAPERFGRAERIDFATRTVVLIAVPPGKTGVGDVDGQAAETSPGWDRREARE
jgi:hypothetical protein